MNDINFNNLSQLYNKQTQLNKSFDVKTYQEVMAMQADVEGLFDLDGNKQVNNDDLLNFSGEYDLDGDGNISEAEKKFLAEQKEILTKVIDSKQETTEVVNVAVAENTAVEAAEDNTVANAVAENVATNTAQEAATPENTTTITDGNTVTTTSTTTDGKVTTTTVTKVTTTYKTPEAQTKEPETPAEKAKLAYQNALGQYNKSLTEYQNAVADSRTLLLQINQNKYSNLYRRKFATTTTTLTADELKEAEAKYAELQAKIPELQKQYMADYQNYTKVLCGEYAQNRMAIYQNDLKELNENKEKAKILNTDPNYIKEAESFTIDTEDTALKEAFDSLSATEKAIIKALDIDITATFPDGSPKYVIANSYDLYDKRYRIYECDAPGSMSGTSLLSKYAPAKQDIWDRHSIWLRQSYGTIGAPEGSSVFIPTKTEKTIVTETETTVTVAADNEVEEVMDEIKELYYDLLEENNNIGKPNMEALETVQKEIITAFANGEIAKDQIAEAIVARLKELGTDGAKILEEYNDSASFKGQKLHNLINKLTGIIESTKTKTETTTTQTTETSSSISACESDQKYTTFNSDPIALDINGDGVKTNNKKVAFDIDGDGKLETISNTNDGILVFDADGNGIAGENGKELFGENTDLDGNGNKDGFSDGFAALKALAKKEGLINETTDNVLSLADIKKLEEKYGFGLKVGYDGAVQKLSDLGISEINFGSTDATKTVENYDGQGNNITTQDGATFKINGDTRSYADLWQKYKKQ